MEIQGGRVSMPGIGISDRHTGRGAGHADVSTEQQLVLAAQAGCRVAFSELWDLYSLRVYRTLLKITLNSHDAEDALQDAFLRAFVAIKTFERRANFYTWLTRIAMNSGLGILRKRRTRSETPLNADPQKEDEGPQEEFRDSAPDPEQIYAEQEVRERLMQAIQRLPLRLRTATEALVAGNCSVKEVAYRLNISESAAKSRLCRARIMLGSLTGARKPKLHFFCHSEASVEEVCGTPGPESRKAGRNQDVSGIVDSTGGRLKYEEVNPSNLYRAGNLTNQQYGPQCPGQG